MDCCIYTKDIDAYFDERQARSEVSQYLKRGLASHARAMLDAVSARGLKDASVLEIGGGIGGLQIELLKRSAARAINVEVSSAYLTAARALAEQLGLEDRVDYCQIACRGAWRKNLGYKRWQGKREYVYIYTANRLDHA